MVYSNMFLFDLYNSVENGKTGKKKERKLMPVLPGPIWLCEYPRPKINKAMCVFCSGGTVLNVAPFFIIIFLKYVGFNIFYREISIENDKSNNHTMSS